MGVDMSVRLDSVFRDVNAQFLSDTVVQEAEERGEMFELEDC